ncbi:2-oxo acid dehydrogenase subunit E2 [Brevundimonas vesicularis]|uniref:2-oxo acid dehydrogenase subunit E2 n=1 Tax=Brevundimonas vesicularis TaxID=41276 RepID=UPI0015718A3F|nr:2-oxo acid dehydrogenase subunit E2 [Brevundimonas vesicularis]NSX34658.1 2-oxo acid dehydrogenase subunit E2 [Brevundimonas vesicularis]
MGRFVFKLPDVGEGTAEAELVGWHVKVGDTVAEDQIVADVMTDKATVEITAPVSGEVVALHGEPGAMVPVRGPLVEFEVEGAGNADGAATPVASAAAKPDPAPMIAEGPKIETPAAPAAEAPTSGNYVFKLPDVGEGTAEAELVGWHVKVGDAVEEDQIIADIMTDKATVEITSPVAGTVVALYGEAGKSVPVGGPLVAFDVEGRGNVSTPVPAPKPASKPTGNATTASAAIPTAQSATSATALSKPVPALTGRAPGERPSASPAVRNRARDLGVDLTFVPGSGPAGRITHEDLDGFIARGGSQPASAPSGGGSTYAKAQGTTEVKIIGLRRKIAEKMAESVRRIPHITYVEEIDMTAVEELRAHLNATKSKDQPKLNVLPFIARAIVVALRDQPQINATYDDEAGVLTQHAPVHLGIAAQTPNGLMVPVVRHAEARDPYDTALEIARVSGAAKDGSAKRDELSGSTITITSLGTLGGVVHTPIINHPEVAIVGPNKIAERVMVKDGQMVVRKMMNLSSSFDHRIVDGHDAAVFVQRIKGLLENPATLWMG